MEVTEDEYNVIVGLLKAGRRDDAYLLLENNPRVRGVNLDTILDNIIRNEGVQVPVEIVTKQPFIEKVKRLNSNDKWSFVGVFFIIIFGVFVFFISSAGKFPALEDLETITTLKAAECEKVIKKGRRGATYTEYHITIKGLEKMVYKGPRPEEICYAMTQGGKKTLLISREPIGLYGIKAEASGGENVVVLEYEESVAGIDRGNRRTRVICVLIILGFLGLGWYHWVKIHKESEEE